MSDIEVLDVAVSPKRHISSVAKRVISFTKGFTTGALLVVMTTSLSVLDKATRITTLGIEHLSNLDERRNPKLDNKVDSCKVQYTILRPISLFGSEYSVNVLRFTGVDYHRVGNKETVIGIRLRGSISAIRSLTDGGKTAYTKSLVGLTSKFGALEDNQTISLQSEGKECWIILFIKREAGQSTKKLEDKQE